MNPILPNSRTDLPGASPTHPFLIRLAQRRDEMAERAAAKAEAEGVAYVEPLARSKARNARGGRLPHGIYRGSTCGTFRADAGREPILQVEYRAILWAS